VSFAPPGLSLVQGEGTWGCRCARVARRLAVRGALAVRRVVMRPGVGVRR